MAEYYDQSRKYACLWTGTNYLYDENSAGPIEFVIETIEYTGRTMYPHCHRIIDVSETDAISGA
jgi:hypothetical protein